jgi:3-oxoacyl-[acyl-carrier protein] reductase
MSDAPVAIVTGSSRGIGRAIALGLAREGYRITVNYSRSADTAEAVVSEIENMGSRAIAVGASVGVAEHRERLVDRTCDAFGRIDMLVNNAGITSVGRKDLLEATEESWDQVFDINLKGPFFLSQLVANQMLKSPTTDREMTRLIVNISSISAFAVSTNRADYCLTKAAMHMMTKLFAVRLADADVHVFEVIPGIIATDMTAAVREKYDRLILQEGITPIRRWGRPEDVADAVVSLARGGFRFCTGDQIHVDGGFHIRQL